MRTTAIFLLMLLTLMAIPGAAYAQLPFGGPIVSLFPCLNGLSVIVGPPRGGQFFYIPSSSFSYLFGPPASAGQNLLGMAGGFAVCLIPCPPPANICPDPAHSGFLILFHGSSRPGGIPTSGTPSEVPNNPGLEVNA